MNMKTISKASDLMPADLDADRFFDELQARWDEHARRLDNAPLPTLNSQCSMLTPQFYKRPPRRILSLRRHLLLFVVALAASIYWALLIPSLAYTAPACAVSLVIEAIYILLAAESLCHLLSLLIYNPARVSLLRMSRHLRRAQSLAAQEGGSRKVSTPQSPILLVAVVALVVASCVTTGGDGYAMACGQHSRAAVVESVNQTIDKI